MASWVGLALAVLVRLSPLRDRAAGTTGEHYPAADAWFPAWKANRQAGGCLALARSFEVAFDDNASVQIGKADMVQRSS
jgi:hypothetical protein